MSITPFETSSVLLEKSNLIEASAGTGKTYSIAILVLRLLLEKNIPIQEILMVTFTKAAVAELETRVREFVRIAHGISKGQKSNDKTIEDLVESSINKIGSQEAEFRLKTAMLFLDETAILTIHGFCQRILSEFAFETNQVFGSEAMSETDMNMIMVDYVNDFWRKQIVVIERDLLAYLSGNHITRNSLLEIIKNVLGGKNLLKLGAFEPDILSLQKQQLMLSNANKFSQIIFNTEELAINYLIENKDALQAIVSSNQNAVKKFLHLFDDPYALFDVIMDSQETQYVRKIFTRVFEIMEPAFEAKELLKSALNLYANKVYQLASHIICSNVQKQKEKRSLLAFDDMINKLHHAIVTSKNINLINAIQLKYQAVFIDEFQDTDKKQYEIFDEIFGDTNILFYIGDPKQSIYAWRKADINTYFKARNSVANRFGMNTNFRSSDGIIHAQNAFFKPTNNFDTFYFDNASDAIEYINVEPPNENKKGTMQFEGVDVVPITIYEDGGNDLIIETVTATVIDLLSKDGYKLPEKDNWRNVRPSDIGILVRGKKNGKKIKERLASFKIPAVTIDETKISETAEAKELLYVMQAVNEINASNINKALLTGLTGFKIEQVLAQHQEQVLNQFKDYQQAWTKEGIYVMMMRFMTDFSVKSTLLDFDAKNGERRLSNVFQLLELLHKTQVRSQLAPVELINWLQKIIEGKILEGDEFEQRIESDEDAVKIVTIHSSKGLEYNIVIAPFLDLKPEIKEFASFRDEETGEYLFANADILTTDQQGIIQKQLEQENRRLIYVAITRAKYKCYINRNVKTKTSSLKTFTDTFKSVGINAVINFEESPESDPSYRYYSASKRFPIEYKKAKYFNLEQKYWRKISYTFLNPTHNFIPKITTGVVNDAYSDFIFRKLRKGAFTGNLLHYIFEFIHFSDSSQWEKTIATALKRLSPGNQETYEKQLLELLHHVTESSISCNGNDLKLSEINNEVRLNEFEFDFSVKPFLVAEISSLSTNEVPFNIKSIEQLEGMMNGKMDLFFEKDGKYYILDWKSNYLGDTIVDYSTEKVEHAMIENNYHLQYHIYTVAICKYLALRIPDFNYEKHFGGVIYVFLRGVRKDGETGIFFSKPKWDIIDKMKNIFTLG